jgi:Na+-transporting NADH:ubiquinone oxidoreductase subunit A
VAKRFDIAKGLDLPIGGTPQQTISESPSIRTVALVGDDYIGLRPAIEVREGDHVKLGQVVMTDKRTPGVGYTSPGCGTVVAVNRGPKRHFESIVIELDGDDELTFNAYSDHNLARLDRHQVRDQLTASGIWTALRTRPYSKVPDPNSVPQALLVTAIDTNPLAADPAVVLADRAADFTAGLQALSTLPDGPTYLCKAPGSDIPGCDLTCIEVAEFAGPHPAGLVGTHIHLLYPASDRRVVWHMGYQDVAAVGHLLTTGRLSTERVVSLAGPAVTNPRLARTRLGASLEELTAGEDLIETRHGVRTISGSVLSGRQSTPMRDYLGRYHLQITLVPEGGDREFLAWLAPGWQRFSFRRVFASTWAGGRSRRFAMTTALHGGHRAIVPIGVYEQVMPMDILATPLLKALVVEDTEQAQSLGCLELDEEDLALCSFVCPSKIDYGPILRRNLTRIEREG